MASVKITKQEFKDLLSKHVSIFLAVCPKKLDEDKLLQWNKQYERGEVGGATTRIGTPNNKGVWFSDGSGERSYLELADDKYNKREVYNIANTSIYYVKYISNSQNGTVEKYMYYRINIL